MWQIIALKCTHTDAFGRLISWSIDHYYQVVKRTPVLTVRELPEDAGFHCRGRTSNHVLLRDNMLLNHGYGFYRDYGFPLCRRHQVGKIWQTHEEEGWVGQISSFKNI